MSVDHLLELSSVRERCNKLADAQLTYWTVDESKLPDVTRYVLNLIQRDYNNDPTKIRPHGRWSHFLAAGTDRITPLLAAWTAEGADESEVCRRMIDLTVVSVLLDAGAGAWQYTEAQSDGSTTAIGRSEGLAVASLHMFQRGLFSSNQQYKHQVDADALKAISTDDVLQGLQISASNPMPGAEGRAGLLLRLGQVLSDSANAPFFARDGSATARPGHLLDYVQGSAGGGPFQVQTLWHALITGLAKVWPQEGRTKLFDKTLGDVWLAEPLLPSGVAAALASEQQREPAMVPFHKLTQWLCYSLVEVIETITSKQMFGKEAQTGLPEYRNAGLFTDFGVFKPQLPAFARSFKLDAPPSSMLDLPPLAAAHPGIVEWRALTVVFLDRIHKEVVKGLGQQLSLAQEGLLRAATVLEAGTWKAGREIAKEKRPQSGGPPLHVLSDGTVF